MKAIQSIADLMSGARQQEQAGRLEEAADQYQRVVDQDPGNKEAVRRLLMMYRKLKDYRKELAVIKAVLTAIADRDQSAQKKWIAAHPEAARLGRSMLRSLGGQQVTAYGTDPMVQQLLRRKELVEQKISGHKGRKATKATKSKTASSSHESVKIALKARQAAAAEQRRAEKAAAAERKRTEQAAKRQAAIEVKKQAAAAKKQAAATRKQAAAAKKQAAAVKKQAAEAAAHPSLFVITLRYLVGLEKIDAVMKKHVTFLQKHFRSGDFLVSGRQVPRTGGVIIARGKDRTRVERIMKQDPFVKGRLASVDIVEFRPSSSPGIKF